MKFTTNPDLVLREHLFDSRDLHEWEELCAGGEGQPLGHSREQQVQRPQLREFLWEEEEAYVWKERACTWKNTCTHTHTHTQTHIDYCDINKLVRVHFYSLVISLVPRRGKVDFSAPGDQAI